MPSCNHSDHTALDLYLSNYALMVENESLEIRVYNRMIEGIPTDDYFIEFYQEGKIVNIYYSSTCINEDEILSISAHIQETISVIQSALKVSASTDAQYRWVNGRLLILRVSEEDTCPCQIEYTYEYVEVNEGEVENESIY